MSAQAAQILKLNNMEKLFDVIKLKQDFNSDSKSKSAEAERLLIELCEPIINEMGEYMKKVEISPCEFFGEGACEYAYGCGRIYNIVKCEDGFITFFYSRGEHCDAYIELENKWIENFDEFKTECNKARMHKITNIIDGLKNQIENIKISIKRLDEEYSQLFLENRKTSRK